MSDTNRIEALLLACDLPAVPTSEQQRLDETMLRLFASARETPATAAPLSIKLTCTYCHDGLTQDTAVYCAGCLAPHHRDCFAEHARCAAPGCDAALMVEPTPPPPRGFRTRFAGLRRGPLAKILLAASVLLAAGVGVSTQFYRSTGAKPAWTAVPPGPTPVRTAVGQTVRFVEPWSLSDPPQGVGFTHLSGAPNLIYSDAVAEVQWAVPHVKGRAILLVRGLEEGSASFSLRFPKSRRVKSFEVVVEGADPHDLARDRRRISLAKATSRQLEGDLRTALASGDAFLARRDRPGREHYYRESLLQYEHATDTAWALLRKASAQGAKPPPELLKTVRRAEDAEATAIEDYEAFVDRSLAVYQDLVAGGAPQEERAQSLERVLRTIDHSCDSRYMRLSLILSKIYGRRTQADGHARCEVGAERDGGDR